MHGTAASDWKREEAVTAMSIGGHCKRTVREIGRRTDVIGFEPNDGERDGGSQVDVFPGGAATPAQQ